MQKSYYSHCLHVTSSHHQKKDKKKKVLSFVIVINIYRGYF